MKLNKQTLLLILGMAFLPISIPKSLAQQKEQPMTLKDCIDYTLGKNPNNLVYMNQVAYAERQKTEGLASYLPQVNLTGAFDDNIKRPTTIIPGAALGSPTDLHVQFGNKYTTGLNLQADQVLYDQTIIEGIKANKPNIEVAVLKKQRNDDDMIYNTAYAYYQVLIYKEQLKLLSENEKKFVDLLKVQKFQYEKGAITRLTLNRVQVSYNNILSQKKVAETNYELSMNRLKNAMGVDIDKDILIVDTINYQQEVVVPTWEDFDIRVKPDYKILEKNIALQEIDLRRKRAASLPTLSGYAKYGTNLFGNEFATSFEHRYDYSAVGLRLNVPIFSSLRRYSQVQESAITLSTNRQNLIINSQTYKLQIENANTQLMNSYNNMQSNKNNLQLAKDVFDDTDLQYQKGATPLTEFLNSDYAYKEAQTNYLNSLVNFLIARIDLERSKGTIKQFAGQL